MICDIIDKCRRKLERQKGQRNQIVTHIELAEDKIDRFERKQIDLEKAQEIVMIVAKATQQKLEYHISELVTLALEAVFPDPYKMHLDFILKRNKSEAVISFSNSKNPDEKIHPMSASGGGVIDIGAFALRVSLWNLQNPRTRNTIVLDEPFRFVSQNLQSKVSKLLKEISERLDIQFIIVTHEKSLIENADKVFLVKNSSGVSKVTEETANKSFMRVVEQEIAIKDKSKRRK